MAKKSDKSAFSALFGYEADLLGEVDVPPLVKANIDAGNDVSIDSIRPDPEQPRSLLDETHYQRLWNGEKPYAVLADWLAVADHSTTAHKQSAEALKELAETILTHGLIQPICFRPKPPALKMGMANFDKLVVVGERRWWAHVYLHATERSFSNQIRALPIGADANIKAIQLIENMIREDLNAVERADGIVALREEMGRNNVKKPTWTQIEKLLGIKRTQRWRLQQVHNLSPAARELVVQHNLAEYAIRPITTHKELRQHPELQIDALHQFIKWTVAEEDTSSQRLERYIETLLKKQVQPSKKSQAAQIEKSVSRIFRKAELTYKAFSILKPDEREQFINIVRQDKKSVTLLRDLRDQLNKIIGD
jgi:hypothetical protein